MSDLLIWKTGIEEKRAFVSPMKGVV